jgi:hypothetical protein
MPKRRPLPNYRSTYHIPEEIFSTVTASSIARRFEFRLEYRLHKELNSVASRLAILRKRQSVRPVHLRAEFEAISKRALALKESLDNASPNALAHIQGFPRVQDFEVLSDNLAALAVIASNGQALTHVPRNRPQDEITPQLVALLRTVYESGTGRHDWLAKKPNGFLQFVSVCFEEMKQQVHEDGLTKIISNQRKAAPKRETTPS